jgi:hypothetical protein
MADEKKASEKNTPRRSNTPNLESLPLRNRRAKGNKSNPRK